MMEIIPAIDLLDGRCVRLEKGDFGRCTVYPLSPVDQARQYENEGFTRLHLVDLNGARDGILTNLSILESIARQTRLLVDYGGGIRSREALSSVFDAGAYQATVGSIVITHPEVFRSWLTQYGAERFILGADTRLGTIACHGWTTQTPVTLTDFIRDWEKEGVTYVLCTDIEKDGMLAGSSLDLYRGVMKAVPSIRLIASGGVSAISDIKAMAGEDIYGVVIGKALLEGRVTISELKEFINH